MREEYESQLQRLARRVDAQAQLRHPRQESEEVCTQLEEVQGLLDALRGAVRGHSNDSSEDVRATRVFLDQLARGTAEMRQALDAVSVSLQCLREQSDERAMGLEQRLDELSAELSGLRNDRAKNWEGEVQADRSIACRLDALDGALHRETAGGYVPTDIDGMNQEATIHQGIVIDGIEELEACMIRAHAA